MPAIYPVATTRTCRPQLQYASDAHCMAAAATEQWPIRGDRLGVHFGAPVATKCPRIARFVLVNRISQNATNVAARLVSDRDTSYCDK